MSISYTISPVHTLDLFAKQAKDMADMGADSICIKDMAGLMSPVAASELVKAIKKKVNLFLPLLLDVQVVNTVV